MCSPHFYCIDLITVVKRSVRKGVWVFQEQPPCSAFARAGNLRGKMERTDIFIGLSAHHLTWGVLLKYPNPLSYSLSRHVCPIQTFHRTGLTPVYSFTNPAPSGGSVIGMGQHVVYDALSDQCLQIAEGWLQECLSRHPGCGRSSTNVFPTRVIDVGSTT